VYAGGELAGVVFAGAEALQLCRCLLFRSSGKVVLLSLSERSSCMRDLVYHSICVHEPLYLRRACHSTLSPFAFQSLLAYARVMRCVLHSLPLCCQCDSTRVADSAAAHCCSCMTVRLVYRHSILLVQLCTSAQHAGMAQQYKLVLLCACMYARQEYCLAICWTACCMAVSPARSCTHVLICTE
jgi:hypothetical protein